MTKRFSLALTHFWSVGSLDCGVEAKLFKDLRLKKRKVPSFSQ